MTQPRNVGGVEFLDIESISVNEYHEMPNGQGQPSEVHLMIELKDLPFPMVMRFHSGQSMDELIVALITHRKAVFGGVQS